VSSPTPQAATAAAKAICALIVCIGWLGCADREDSAQPITDSTEAPPRWTHRYMPKGLAKYDREQDRWRPESEVPRTRETTPGMVVWEVSEYPPESEPTAEQLRAADEFVERCFEAAMRNGWDRIERGLAEGYRPVDRHHYRKAEHMLDDHVFDPDYPEVLMYYQAPPVGNETEGRQRLAGLMFYARDREARGPQIGPQTIWHYHAWYRPQCVLDGLAIGWSVDGKCERGDLSYFSGEMMHVWLVDRPAGHFATPMYLPYKELGPMLEQRLEERGF
jgi:hypothetical protein